MQADSYCPECGTLLPEVLPGGLCPGCTLGAVFGKSPEPEIDSKAPEIEGLTVHEEVGEGGFGIVYRATQTGSLSRKVALKVLKPGVDTRQVLRRFEIERQALALLEHPNIARIYEAGETAGGYPWFTMEYVEGVPVNEALHGEKEREILECIISVCSAITYAHGKGVIHRDLKPSNILVRSEGIPKVIDFGVAKATGANLPEGMTLYTGGDSWLGTPAYMAPEQADPKVLDIDERADVYSLGAILYELLCGVNPMDAKQGETLPPPSTLAIQEVSKNLDQVVLHALKEDREERYQTVGELSADLRRHLNGDRIKVVKKTFPWKWAVAGLAIVSGVFFWPKEKPVDEEVWQFVKLEHRKIVNVSALIQPFKKTKQSDVFYFQNSKGESLVFGFDSEHGSVSAGEIFTGARGPDLPGVRHVVRDSEEDRRLLKILYHERDVVIGEQESHRIEALSWPEVGQESEEETVRYRKMFLGSLWAFKERRKNRPVAEPSSQ